MDRYGHGDVKPATPSVAATHVHDAFVDIRDQETLWVTIDRANGDPRQWEKTRYERAKLTPLGEKLLGLRSWKDQSAAAE